MTTEGVFVSNREIYDEVLALRGDVALLIDRDKRERIPDRVRALEIRSWGIPPALLTGLLGLIAAFAKA